MYKKKVKMRKNMAAVRFRTAAFLRSMPDFTVL